jgi:hypothetical protein
MKIKKNLLKLALLLVLQPAFAINGAYDGIWYSQGMNCYISIHENYGTAVAAFHYVRDTTWEANTGKFDGNKLNVKTMFGFARVETEITFDSTTEATGKIISCEPVQGFICRYPAGAIFTAKKVW